MTIDWANDIDWGDAPAWFAFFISVGAGIIALVALGYARKSAVSSEISAKATVRQAAAAERQVELAEAAAATQPGSRQDQQDQPGTQSGSTLRATIPRQKVSYVAWWIEHQSNDGYLLRNIGTGTARNVEIDESRIRCMVRSEFPVAELPPNASTKMLLSTSLAAPSKPGELWVRWDGHPEWVAVPVP
ncbi:hypothetical protein [Plantactinospora sonchi]|uniref:Uncharacterized protein n=1 Tax=Plantactinospora sonchi TaxID=1544735 RepID=A0ABU7RWS0_9ACTN